MTTITLEEFLGVFPDTKLVFWRLPGKDQQWAVKFSRSSWAGGPESRLIVDIHEPLDMFGVTGIGKTLEEAIGDFTQKALVAAESRAVSLEREALESRERFVAMSDRLKGNK